MAEATAKTMINGITTLRRTLFMPWFSSYQGASVLRSFGSVIKWDVLFGEYLPVTDFVTDFVTVLVGIRPVTVRIGPVFGKLGKAIGICLVVPFTIPVSCGLGTYGLTAAETEAQETFGRSCPKAGCEEIFGTVPVGR